MSRESYEVSEDAEYDEWVITAHEFQVPDEPPTAPLVPRTFAESMKDVPF